MKVAIIGAGGVGGFLGALLARAGHDVGFLARGAHLAAIRERGLELRSKQFGDFVVKGTASDNGADLGPADFVLMGVKMYDFSAAITHAQAALAPNGLVATIQNGLEAPYEIADVVGTQRVLAGTVSLEATLLEPGVVGHMVASHVMGLAELGGGTTPRLAQLVEDLKAAGFNVTARPSAQAALWTKAAMLIPLATLTTAANCGVGILADLPEARALVREMSDEAIAVARACGVDLDDKFVSFQRQVETLAPQSPRFTSSMNRDFLAGRRIELEWLTGALIRVADEQHVEVKAHKALYAVIKLRLATREH